MSEQLILYTNVRSPMAHRVEIALKEAGAKFTRYEVDLPNKPGWFVSGVNPIGKVPAIAYGGPAVPPDQPSPESAKLSESLALVEFVADLFPNRSTLYPSSPILRARARTFIDVVSSKLPTLYTVFCNGKTGDDEVATFLNVFETIQNLLPADKTFAVSDEFTIADVSIAPFLQRTHTALKNDIGPFKVGEGPKLYEAMFASPHFARLQKYFKDLQARKSVQETYFEDKVISGLESRYGSTRAQ